MIILEDILYDKTSSTVSYYLKRMNMWRHSISLSELKLYYGNYYPKKTQLEVVYTKMRGLIY